MKLLSISFEMRFGTEPKPEPEGPGGAESMVIHQDQPRFIGFMPQEGMGEQ